MPSPSRNRRPSQSREIARSAPYHPPVPRPRRPLRHPSQLIALSFAVAVAAGTAVLSLPVATAADGGPPFVTALFTATSAVCVTGLTVVDTSSYWSTFGQAAILAMAQVGGLGIMTLTAFTVFLFGRRVGLRQRILIGAGAQTEIGSARRVILAVGAFTLAFEALAAVVLVLRFGLAYDYPPGQALWHGVFHAVTGFTQSGFALYPDSLVRFVDDPVVTLALVLLVLASGLGFPVWVDLRDRGLRGRRRLSLHTKLMLAGTGALFVVGALTVLAFEWTNRGTLGGLDASGKLLAALFQSVAPRSVGLATIDYSRIAEETMITQTMLMFVGGGPASPAGGIKVTSFLILVLFVWNEARGLADTNAFGRRVPTAAVRQAFSVAFIAMNAVVLAAVVIMANSDFPLNQVLFEVVSAGGTVGLTTGITPDLPVLSKGVLIALMFLGRTGPYTLALALALRDQPVMYRYPEERPIIG